MDPVVAVAIGVLAFVFIMSFVGLVLICKHRYCRMLDLTLKETVSTQRQNVTLVHHAELPEDYEVELNDVCFSRVNLPDLDDEYVDDASGLIPHAIEILKTCHLLTEKLVAMTMGSKQPLKSPDCLGEIVAVAKRISPRVDDVVRSMYPPIDPKLIEARSAALMLSVNHLVLVTKNACHVTENLEWIDASLELMENHQQVLRKASLASEEDSRTGSVSSATESTTQQPLVDEEQFAELSASPV
ncbi:transmembrane protein 98-like [Antedon mediterranea]|uniref:transmembrane protein 98-like n=1 Tax=Antedon mediterranea TaxID=105859 RepID=UPI003AF46BDA